MDSQTCAPWSCGTALTSVVCVCVRACFVSQVDLPLWMATSLADRGMVEVRNPVNFDVGVRNALKADPGSVNLRVRNPYYYEVGMDLCTLVGASELARDLPGILRKVLAVRFNDIFDRSMNSPNEDTTMLTQDLTNLERELFESGHQSASRLFKWKTRKLTRLSTARVFRRGMKRRRAGL